ncbi:MAG: hypothetical protein SVO01_00665 [Thermotogota bacterium]|nr:hypothetical protein [Thermotogota bacterium]
MKKLTRSMALRRHRKQWRRAAEICREKKIDIITAKRKACKELWPDEEPHSNCWLCEYREQSNMISCTKQCLIKWSNGHCMDSEYDDWNDSYDPEKALIIANLPRRRKR